MMNSKDAAQAYRVASVENAPPVKIVRMLYQGALRFLDQAMAADPADPASGFIALVDKIDAIVCELRLALEDEHEPEICGQLRQLYLYVEDELGRASVERSAQRLPDVRDVLVKLLEAWTHVEIESTRVAS